MAIEIENIREAWPQAHFWQAADGNITAGSYLLAVDNIVNMALVLGIILFFAYFFFRILDGVECSFIAVKKMKEMLAIDMDLAVRTSRSIYLAFCFALLFLICVNKKIITFSFWEEDSKALTLATWIIITAAVFVFRKISLSLLDWVNSTEVFTRVEGALMYYLGTLFCFALPLLVMFGLFEKSMLLNIIVPALLVLTVVTLLLYYIRIGRLIFTNGFSLFFYFVYLCTLEILPLVILVKIVLQN